ncbi:sulfatase-like hydrolase/transferase [Paracoccus sp. 1_MG-2023]|uniref:sulfatase-like hydrolase/transferase n=1 Tax=unclassified Paracoccus (in: a-proteobacteria) TaxID=2688777 RepID=UPI0020916269|nr:MULTISPECIES: sulfatase-like hydrolase/transferase [unclassified Paracoccus (in: a-proteobacteria)]MDO6668666.1 sulfatase-like hydrolase/transferase [Paracoccus sp. 1_MG-2023]
MIRRLPILILSVLTLHAIVALPSAPDAFRPATWARPAPELAIGIAALILLGRGFAARSLQAVLVVVIGGLTVLKIADIAMTLSLGRRFNIVADIPLIDASLRLIAGSVGTIGAVATVIAAILLTCAIFAVLWWAFGVWQRLPRIAAVPVVLITGAAFALQPAPLLGSYAARQIATARDTLTQLADFRVAAQQDKALAIEAPLARIDRDVVIVFLESYGRTSFDTQRFASRHLPILQDAQSRLTDAGIAMRSGFLTSPTHGGQSWLAHATLANGLRIDGQTRYRAALASGRRTLFHIAQDAGFRTAAVMPAITRPWPEAQEMGFHSVLDAEALQYRGQPFNWVTMPDQFTMIAMDRLLDDGDPRHLFAQVALISSHAPWVPIPDMVDWNGITDGRQFDAMATSGDTPREVWRDRERVREQYAKSIDYILRVVTGYALRHADDPPLLVLVGDHQAASSIGLDERHEVPIHVIGPAELVDLTASWGLHSGLIPPKASPAHPMEDFRMWFLNAFSGRREPPPA